MNSCFYCGKEAKFLLKNGRWCCCEDRRSCLAIREKISKSLKGKNTGPHLYMLGNLNVSRRSEVKLKKKQTMEKNGTHTGWNPDEEFKEQLRQEMLNGRSAYMNSFNKNPSKPQKHIWKETVKIFPETYLNPAIYHLEKQCNPDVLIPKLEVVIEYDGWQYHHKEEDVAKDVKKQKMLEEDGWKVITYRGSKNKDIYPTKEQIWKDIQKVLNN